MTRALLEDLAAVFALESCDAEDHDEAARLDDLARQIRARAEALRPRAVPMTKGPEA
jgi:hypothetical protein